MLDDVAGTDFVAVDLGHFCFPEEILPPGRRFRRLHDHKTPREARERSEADADRGRRSAIASAQPVGALQRLLLLLVGQAAQEIVHLGIGQAGAAGEEIPGGGDDRVRARCRCRPCRAWRAGSARRRCRPRRRASARRSRPCGRAARRVPRSARCRDRAARCRNSAGPPAAASGGPRPRRASCRRRRWRRSAPSHIARPARPALAARS